MIDTFHRRLLDLDVAQEADRIAAFIREAVTHTLRRQGAVVGISGGIDSSVVLALCVRALGAERVLGVLLPERESSPDSAALAHTLAAHFGVATVTEDISEALAGLGCYPRRDAAIRRMFPDFAPGWKAKIGLSGSLLTENTLNVFRLTVTDPAGVESSQRLPAPEFAQIVAASNFKQRARMSLLYYHAERLNRAVIGTANKNEHDLGFFVKYGDGGVDLQPIAHLFKTQVYQLANYLDVPEEIQQRTPTTDTYPGGSTQEEFFFRLPFDVLDAIWLGLEQNRSVEEIARALDLTTDQVERVIADIRRKQRTTDYLRASPLVME